MEIYTILNTMKAPTTSLVQGLTTAVMMVINVWGRRQEHVNQQQHGVEVPQHARKRVIY